MASSSRSPTVVLVLALCAGGCGADAPERGAQMPATVCMTPDGRCPPMRRLPRVEVGGPVERAVRERPDDAEAICRSARAEIDTGLTSIDRRCDQDRDCTLLPRAYCGLAVHVGAPTGDFVDMWNDYMRACEPNLDCEPSHAICIARRCAVGSLRG